jgi:hypothetical protein
MANDPERDRRLAARPRESFRKVQPVEDLVASFMGSETIRRMKRMKAISAALYEVLTPAQVAKVHPQTLKDDTLTISVEDGVLLSELRNHRQAALLSALAKHKTGAARIVWRTARSPTA